MQTSRQACGGFVTRFGGAQRGSLRDREQGFEFVSPWYRHVHYGTSRWMQNAPRLLVAQFPYAKNIKILDCFVAQCDSRRTPSGRISTDIFKMPRPGGTMSSSERRIAPRKIFSIPIPLPPPEGNSWSEAGGWRVSRNSFSVSPAASSIAPRAVR